MKKVSFLVVKLFVIISILSCLLAGCLPADSARSRLSQDPDNPSSTNSGETENPFGNGQDLELVVGSTPMSNPIVQHDLTNPIYLRGNTVTSFFNNEANATSNVYCLTLNFNNIIIDPILGTQGNRQLRLRAVADNFNDITLNQTTPIFKIELNNLTLNQASCAGAYQSFDSAIAGQVFYSAQTLCPTCATTIVADAMSIVKSEGSPLALSSNTQLLNASNLSISILSPNSSSTGGSGSVGNPNNCTALNCNQAGFCCSSETNACVEHASVKDGFQGTPELTAALAAIDLNPASINNFSAIFHLCPGQPSGGSGSNDGSTGTDTITEIQTDYLCAEELRANATATPYQLFISTNPNSCDPALPGSCECIYDAAQSSENLYYLNVLERLYSYCNCQGATLNDKLANCPTAFYYDVVTQNAQGLPTQVACSAVEVPGFDPNVAISSRSVPHRFYSDSGQAINDLSTASQATVQEGDEFSYIGGNTIFPVNGSFNMNSILGSMPVNQQGALPAKAVNVVQGQTYIVRNVGNDSFIPCPTCGNDSWFPPFKAQPTANIRGGFGLKAIGHTTRRDQQQFNSNLGNYEDTIWGRACFVPPTMLPFSHKQTGVTDINDSRRIRLETQAAMFINGYQRDWFGFNYGATIGSFDGVSWFAIGTSRLVEATSDKLYLAFNAPYGDLTSPNLQNLTVEPFIPGSQASQFDYDPTAANDSLKNQAGSCQQYHICKSDSDCITQLGWEYVCASATGRRTQWPRFNSTDEEINTSSARSIIGILQQSSLPSTDTNKRCVYRGAGSPCAVDPLDITDEQLRRSFTCATNFHCAPPSSPTFNKEIARFANPLSEVSFLPGNHLFGQDANILGRPLDYISSSLHTLPTIVAETLKENLLANNTPTLNKVDPSVVVGLCRPGKRKIPLGLTIDEVNDTNALSVLNSFPQIDPLRSQSLSSSTNETDYISQIGLARDDEYTDYRYISCPVIDNEDGNLLHLDDKLFTRDAGLASFLKNYRDLSVEQNSTGVESLSNTSNSPFESIEGPILGISELIALPTLVQNACLRKAGATCHTDLDCGPGRLHSGLAQFFNEDEFGNIAEKAYYQESLICGQAERKPSPGTTRFELFDIRKNRCCRDIGNDLTIYTSNTPQLEFTLDTKKPGHLFPQDTDRYSRLSVNEDELNASTNINLSGIIELLEGDRLSQWKTIHSAAKRTCCGGGWVRKFSNGTHNWNNPVQFNVNPSQFKCLNYITPFATYEASELESIYGVPTTITNSQRNFLCDNFSSNPAACAQIYFPELDFDNITPPRSLLSKESSFDSTTFNDVVTLHHGSNFEGSLYAPYKGILGSTAPSFKSGTISNEGGVLTMDPAESNINTELITNIILPSFIPRQGVQARPGSDTEFIVSLFKQTTSGPGIEHVCGYVDLPSSDTTGVIFDPGMPTTNLTLGTTGPPYNSNGCRATYYSDQNILKVRVWWSSTSANAIRNDLLNNDATYTVGVRFTAPGTYKPQGTTITDPGPAASNGNYGVVGLGMQPGSPQFYLNRLSRMELSGIPQVFHEALYCNDNQVKLIPGLYNTDMYAASNLQSQPDQFTTDNSSTEFEVIDAFTDASSFPGDPGHNISPAIYKATNPSSPAISGGKYITTYKGLDTAPVFSEHEFACCHKLGTFAATQDLCCSGYGQSSSSPGVLGVQCTLPTGTNLNVYFNRFVSGESDGQELEDVQLALSDDDFLEHTGEPDMTKDTVRTKLQNLAVQFCESGNWRMGGAFGDFYPQPNNSVQSIVTPGTALSIIDSPNDSAGNVSGISNSGSAIVDYQSFISGYRWNNHIYCDD